MLAQILKGGGPRVGLDLCLATDVPRIHGALGELIGSAADAGPADVVDVDLEFVAPDLSAVPLDEVLDFRARHAAAYQSYARGLRSVVRELRQVEPTERESILADRRDELAAAAHDLRQGPLRDLKAGGVMALGLVAGVAGIFEGSPVSGAFGAAAVAAGAAASSSKPPEAFSYLFSVGREMT